MNLASGILILMVLGWITGAIKEHRHFVSLRKREKRLSKQCLLTVKKRYVSDDVGEGYLVTGSAVISLDYFKRVLARIRKFFGGELKSYQSLLERARREALLRMQEEAEGADYVLNCRIETAAIGKEASQRRSVASIEALAYGTAIKLKKSGTG